MTARPCTIVHSVGRCAQERTSVKSNCNFLHCSVSTPLQCGAVFLHISMTGRPAGNLNLNLSLGNNDDPWDGDHHAVSDRDVDVENDKVRSKRCGMTSV